MERLCNTIDKQTGYISWIYTILHDDELKLPYMICWERDLGEELDRAEWNTLAQFNSKSLVNTSLIEANYKVFLRWYMVPVRLAAAVREASPQCFRGCGERGTVLHIWCPKVRRFWIRVYNFIYSLTLINLVKSPLHALRTNREYLKTYETPGDIHFYRSQNSYSPLLEISSGAIRVA